MSMAQGVVSFHKALKSLKLYMVSRKSSKWPQKEEALERQVNVEAC